jgi:hypothetical protein
MLSEMWSPQYDQAKLCELVILPHICVVLGVIVLGSMGLLTISSLVRGIESCL